MVKFNSLLFVFILVFSSINAQTISVYAETDSTEYMVGDYINYSLEIIYDKDIKVSFPSIKDSISVLEFIKEYPVAKSENEEQIIELHKFVFSKYDSAGVLIPGINISYTIPGDNIPRFIRSNEIDIVVRTLEVDAQADIQDVKKPIRIPFDWLFWSIFALILIAILTGLFFLYRYYKRKKAGQVITKRVVKIPPHRIALKSLSELEEKKLWQHGAVKEYHSDITGIIRKYFEERFRILAMEMPSSELMETLVNIHDADKIFDEVRDFLNNADLVKFAKFQPMPSVNEEMMKQAYNIVQETIPAETEFTELEEVDVK
jgi:hypothetical protein